MTAKRSKIRQNTRRSARLLQVLFRQFKGFILTTILAFGVSTVLLYTLYPLKELPAHHHSFLGVAYDTLQMIFFQTPIPFIDDWRLVPVFFGLPLIGLLVIAEGAVHLGQLLFQHRTYSREWQEMMAATFEEHIVVAGLGNVGFRVVQQLRGFGQNVVCIERDATSSFIAEMEKYDVPVLVGDCKNIQILENASVRKARAFMALTDDDLANLESALNVREMAPDVRIVMRMFDQRLAQKVEKTFSINCAFSASALSAPVFAQAALSGNILASFEFGGATVNAFQLTVDQSSPLSGRTVDEARQSYEITVLMHQRAGTTDWNPAPQTVLQNDDRLLIMAENKNIQTFLRP